MEVLREGYHIPFSKTPTLSKDPISLQSYSPSSIKGLALQKEILSLLQKGAIEPAPHSPGFYSRVFVVTKASGAWRLIIDLSILNKSVVETKFRMETTRSVLSSLRRGDWMVSLDLQDAYLQIPIHQDSRKFLSLPVQGPPLRPHDLPSSFHQGDGSSFGDRSLLGHQTPPLSGRLACPIRLTGEMPGGKEQSPRDMRITRYHDKSRKINYDTISDNRLHRSEDKLNIFSGFSNPQKDRESFNTDRRISILRRAASNSLETTTRPPVIPLTTHPRGPPENEVSTNTPQVGLELLGRISHPEMGRQLSPRPTMVDRPGTTELGPFPRGALPRPHVLVRRVRRGMGSTSGGRLNLRPLVQNRKGTLHQPKRTQSCKIRTQPLPKPTEVSTSRSLHGQLNSRSISEEGRRNCLSPPQQRSSTNPEMGGETESLHHPSIYSREEQCPSRRPLPKEPDHLIRVDSPSRSSFGDNSEMAGNSGPVCDQPQFQIPNVLRSPKRPSERRHGCLFTKVGRLASICLPPILGDTPSYKQSHDLSQPRPHSDRSTLASEGVVPRFAGTSSGTSPPVARTERSSQTTTFPPLPSKSPSAKPSCLETVQQFARHEGFSKSVAKQLSLARRKSTRIIYQNKWNTYRKWCRKKGHSVSRPSLPKITEFLLYLHETKHLSLPCIRGYRSMLSLVFRWKIPQLSSSTIIKDLLRSFAIAGPQRKYTPPPWDLNEVLSSLMRPPYEPIGQSNFRSLTKKTLFLVALATAKRVSELQALSARVSSLGTDMSVSYVPSFVAKTESANNQIPRSFIIQSLDNIVGPHEEERLLCPVRALKYYLKETKDIPSRPSNLFVSPKNRSRPMSKNATSYFLRETIQGSKEQTNHPPRAHSIRGISTSFNFVKNWSLKQVLNAAIWKSNTVFASYYLKDISHQWDNCRSLGPFVAAGQILNTSDQP